MTAIVEWVERRTGTRYPRTTAWVVGSALVALLATIIEALP